MAVAACVAPTVHPITEVNRTCALEHGAFRDNSGAEVQDAFERDGTYVVSTNPQAFREYIEVEYAKWRGVVRAVNLQIN